YFTDALLHDLMCCRIVSLSIRHGNADYSPHGYVNYGATLGRLFEKWQEARRFGELASEVIERGHFHGAKPSAYFTTAFFITIWTRPIREALEAFRRSFAASIEYGDMNHACYSAAMIVICRFVAGDSLKEVADEAARQLTFAGPG